MNSSTNDELLVTVAIPTYNRKNMVSRLLESILNSTYRNLEIIVVDDDSDDGTVDYLREKYGDKIKLVVNAKNSGVAFSRNTALRIANGKYIFLIDDDNIVINTCIAKLVNVLEKNQGASMVGPVMRYYSKPEEIWWAGTQRNMATSRTTYMFNKSRSLPDKSWWETVDFPNCWMLRAELGKQVKFDETLRMHYEESDFAYRLKQLGAGKFLVVGDAGIFHDVTSDPADVQRRWLDFERVFFTARNRVVFHKRYSTKAQLVAFTIFWVWAFTAHYLKFIFGLKLGGIKQNIFCAANYLWGTIVGFASK